MRNLNNVVLVTATLLGCLLTAGSANARSPYFTNTANLRAESTAQAMTSGCASDRLQVAAAATTQSDTDRRYCVRSCTPEYGCQLQCYHLAW